MHQSDILIIGAGPAGTSTALLTARLGYKVTILARPEPKLSKPCGEYITEGALRVLRDQLGVMPNLMDGGAVNVEQEVVIPRSQNEFAAPVTGLACPRSITDSVLRRAAITNGVNIVDFNVKDVITDSNNISHVHGCGADGFDTYRGRILVGADGTKSIIARSLGLISPIPRLRSIALVGHFKKDSDFSARSEDLLSSVSMHLPVDGTRGCCGIGPQCGPDKLFNINIVIPVSESRKVAGSQAEYFNNRIKKAFPKAARVLESASMIGSLSSVGCFGHYSRRAQFGNTLLVGDAATFIHPFTGEGVYFALQGAVLAANSIDKALQSGSHNSISLDSYDFARAKALYPRFVFSDIVQAVAHNPALMDWTIDRLRNSAALAKLLSRVLKDTGSLAKPVRAYTMHSPG